MSVLRRTALPGSSSRRRWWIAAIALLSVVTALIALTRPTPTPAVAPVAPPSTTPTPSESGERFPRDAGTNSDGGS